MRLHKLTPEQIEAWRECRAQVGRNKYGDKHLQRNGPADIMEELLDSENILELMVSRVIQQCGELTHRQQVQINALAKALTDAKTALVELDKYLPDKVCTDEQGGERVWLSDQEVIQEYNDTMLGNSNVD